MMRFVTKKDEKLCHSKSAFGIFTVGTLNALGEYFAYGLGWKYGK